MLWKPSVRAPWKIWREECEQRVAMVGVSRASGSTRAAEPRYTPMSNDIWTVHDHFSRNRPRARGDGYELSLVPSISQYHRALRGREGAGASQAGRLAGLVSVGPDAPLPGEAGGDPKGGCEA